MEGKGLAQISPLFTDRILHDAVVIVHSKKFGADPSLQVASYSIDNASGKGDGFLGIIHRITVLCNNGKTVKVIGKGMPEDIERRKTFQCNDFFDREIEFYNKIVPMLRNFERKYHNGESLLQIPDCYYTFSDGMNDFLVMEDLIDSGYSMPDKAQGLNSEQSAGLLQMLAQFHAVSLAMKFKEPEVYQTWTTLREPIFREDQKSWIENYLLNLSVTIIEETHGMLDQEHVQRFKKFADRATFFDRMIEIAGDRGSECVVNHGDAWATNFMFQRGTCKAIDFQLVRFGSPMLDLSTAIFSCTTKAERERMGGVPGTIDIYFNVMHATLTKLGVPNHGVTSSGLYQLWRDKFGAYGLGVAIELVPISVVDGEDVGEAEDQHATLNLEDMARFIKVKTAEAKQRLADMVELAVQEYII